MNASTIFGMALMLFLAILLGAGFTSRNMPNNVRGVNADRDTAPFAFWLWAGIHGLGILFGLAVILINWGK